MMYVKARATKDAVVIWKRDFIAALSPMTRGYFISGLARLATTHGLVNLRGDRSWFYIEGNRVMGVFADGLSRSQMDEIDHLCRSYCDSFTDVFISSWSEDESL